MVNKSDFGSRCQVRGKTEPATHNGHELFVKRVERLGVVVVVVGKESSGGEGGLRTNNTFKLRPQFSKVVAIYCFPPSSPTNSPPVWCRAHERAWAVINPLPSLPALVMNFIMTHYRSLTCRLYRERTINIVFWGNKGQKNRSLLGRNYN